MGSSLGGPVSKGVPGIYNPLYVATLDNCAKFGPSKFARRCNENSKKGVLQSRFPVPRACGITIQSHFGKPSGFFLTDPIYVFCSSSRDKRLASGTKFHGSKSA